MPVDDDLPSRLRGAFASLAVSRLGVAVSGGGDSVALLHLLADWAGDGGPALHVVTVDHGLRAASAAEAAGVAALCHRLNLSHDTLHWGDWDGTGNLMDASRRARMRLIAGWAKGRGIGSVALGHTADDQAETFLMRLARGSGVDGLSAMAPHRDAMGILWVRPFLSVRRDALRSDLVRRGATWIDDPTNDDPQYDRIKARHILAALEPLGISVDRIGSTVTLVSMARAVLQAAVVQFVATSAREQAGSVIIDKAALRDALPETRLRCLAETIRWVASCDYRPRLEPLTEACAAVLAGHKRTLSGCILRAGGTEICITREPNAVAQVVCPTDGLWDNRWRVEGPHEAGLQVRALGEAGLKACPNWRETGFLRDTLLASPAIWRGEALIAAPLTGTPNGWTAEIPAGFNRFIVSH